MGTRSINIIANPKGDFIGSYCHWDGYPSHNGRILREHYSNKGKARKLVQLGSLSSLAERVAPVCPELHSFDNREIGATVAYHRDRNEPWDEVKPVRTETLTELVQRGADMWCEYVYLFWNGHWSYNTVEDALAGKAYEPLTEENTQEQR